MDYVNIEDKELISLRGEKLLSSKVRQIINLEVNNEYITICIKQIDVARTSSTDIYLYIFDRRDKSIWVGGNTINKRSIKGKMIPKWDEEYLCAITSMKSYLGELFLLRPNDLRVFHALVEIGGNNKLSFADGILRILFKLSKD